MRYIARGSKIVTKPTKENLYDNIANKYQVQCTVDNEYSGNSCLSINNTIFGKW